MKVYSALGKQVSCAHEERQCKPYRSAHDWIAATKQLLNQSVITDAS
jgi:hypothetical protein